MSPVEAFLAAVQAGDARAAEHVLLRQPRIARENLHVAAALGLEAEVRRLVAANPGSVHERAGSPPADPLFWLCASPFHGESPEHDHGLAACARALLEAGADPNTAAGPHRLPALLFVTGERDVPRIAHMLLEAGARVNDGESVFHAAERFHAGALELLIEFGVDLNDTGDWGNTPLYFLLRHWDVERQDRVDRGFRWLLEHGADPNVRCGPEDETSLHVAVRRGQGPGIVKLLLDRGADVHARRGDGRTAWSLARRGGYDDLALLLESAGARPEPLSRADLLLAACGRGDSEEARRLAAPDLVASLETEELRLLPEAAWQGRVDVVLACLAAGFPADVAHENGATALHLAAFRGQAPMVRALLAHGADFGIRDLEHRSTALGWACFGADFVREPGGDYAACVRALLEAGARPLQDEHEPGDSAVREVLGGYAADRDR